MEGLEPGVYGPVVYDKAKWHYEGTFPKDLDRHQAFVPTGMFLAWIIDHDLYSDEFAQDNARTIPQLKERQITGARVLEIADGAFCDDMLNEEGNGFARNYFYFKYGGRYWADYEAMLGDGLPTLYHIADTWANYDRIKPVIDRRYREWATKAVE